MPEIVVENLSSKAIHCQPKTERLLDILVAEVEWMRACGGKGKCTTCAAQILTGRENLSTMSEEEKKFKALGKLATDERLACQCQVTGDVTVRVPERNQWPHLKYSN